MLKEYKTKIIIVAALFVLMLILLLFYNMLKPSIQITKEKESVYTKKEKINLTEVKKEVKVKPKYYTQKIVKDNNLNIPEYVNYFAGADIDTATNYIAQADTSIQLNDSTGRLRAQVGINTSFNSDIPLSKNSFFDIKYNIKTFGYDTEEKQIVKEIIEERETNIFSNFGLGLFAGGIYTKDKQLDYGIGIGIIYKLTK
ncbi:MAG: hypothetical protein V1773_01045 [bacterium]